MRTRDSQGLHRGMLGGMLVWGATVSMSALLCSTSAFAADAATGAPPSAPPAAVETPAAPVAAPAPVATAPDFIVPPPLPPGAMPSMAGDLKPPVEIAAPPAAPEPVIETAKPAAATPPAAPEAPKVIEAAKPAPAPVAATVSPAPSTAASGAGTVDSQIVQAARALLAKAGTSTRDDRGALAAYYANPGAKPLWVDDNGIAPRGQTVVAELKLADDWGLRAADYDVTGATRKGMTAAELADLDTRIGLAALKYARHARGGRVDPAVISENLDRKPQLADPKVVLAGMSASATPDAYLRGMHPQHPQFEKLRLAYNVMRNAPPVPPPSAAAQASAAAAEAEAAKGLKKGDKKKTDAPAAPVKGSVKKLLANLEMWRWMPLDLGPVHVFVNIPEFQFRLMDKGTVVHTERVITGKVITQTPIFTDMMQTVVFKPRWNVPDSIKVKELLPELLKSNGALAKQGLVAQLNGQDVAPASINWSQTDIRNFHIFQPSGDTNALGVVKFLFPNKHAVYLHDTPSKPLFNQPSRAYSHGCIRIRNPVRFAEVLMERDKAWKPEQVKQALAKEALDDSHVALTRKFPVHIAYFTAQAADDGSITYYRDIYSYDDNINLALDGKAHLIVKPEKEVATPLGGVRTLDDPRVTKTENAIAKVNPNWARDLFGLN